MALIHEATGTVLHDYGGQLENGRKVVLVPLEAAEGKEKANYRINSKFASSGNDGFMRDMFTLPRNRVIPVKNDSVVYVFSEILSVALSAVSAFESARQVNDDSFGVWGDGSMGFVMGLALRCKYPDAKIYVFGKTARKSRKFSFASKTIYIDNVPPDLIINHAFECVGSAGSELAIRQILKLISPQGTVSLLGVNEDAVLVNTRRILEKGLIIIGNSRSDEADFHKAVKLIRENELCKKYLRLLISETIEVKTEEDIYHAFDQDVLNDFKTVIKWSL
jgi:ribitol-5-phosphate 2-dehydrogenase